MPVTPNCVCQNTRQPEAPPAVPRLARSKARGRASVDVTTSQWPRGWRRGWLRVLPFRGKRRGWVQAGSCPSEGWAGECPALRRRKTSRRVHDTDCGSCHWLTMAHKICEFGDACMAPIRSRSDRIPSRRSP